MERLTYKCKDKAYCDYGVRDIINKLAEYEDAEEKELLFRLPCEIGSTVYLHMIVGVDKDKRKLILKVIEGKVIKYTLDAVTICFWVETKDCHKTRNELPISAFGETAFFTKEEAEQALTDIQGK